MECLFYAFNQKIILRIFITASVVGSSHVVVSIFIDNNLIGLRSRNDISSYRISITLLLGFC